MNVILTALLMGLVPVALRDRIDWKPVRQGMLVCLGLNVVAVIIIALGI